MMPHYGLAWAAELSDPFGILCCLVNVACFGNRFWQFTTRLRDALL
jgi:hypothetical protein